MHCDVQSDALLEMRKGQYQNRKFQKTVLPDLQQGRTSILEVHSVAAVLRQQGFDLDPVIDNKSVYQPDQLFDKLAKYGSMRSWNPKWDAFDLAWDLAMKAFGRPVNDPLLQPMALTEVKLQVKMAKSAGLPACTKKLEDVERAMSAAYRIIEGQKKPDPCISYHRIQHGEKGPKLRLVWGFPFSQTLVEGTIAAPLIAHFLSRRTPMVFGYTKLGVAARLARISNRHFQYGFDFSGFDSSIAPKLIQRAFIILRTWFPQTSEVDHLFSLVENYFVFTPIVMPDGFIYQKKRGVPSGSWLTQLVDSIVNYFAIQYCMICSTGRPINLNNICVLGDDSIIGINQKISVSSFVRYAETIGLTINSEKTSVSKDGLGLEFLGHSWQHGVAHRDVADVAKRMAFPEKWIKVPQHVDYSEARMVAFISDCPEAWEVIRLAPFAKGKQPFSVAFTSDSSLRVTGWQLFMHVVYGDDCYYEDKPCNPLFFYAGAAA